MRERIQSKIVAQIAGWVILLLMACQQHPLLEFQAAKESLEEARNAGAYEYALESMLKVEELFRRAQEEIKVQDARLTLVRHYDDAQSLLTEVTTRAHKLTLIARDLKEQTRREATTRLVQTRLTLDEAKILLLMAPSGGKTKPDLQARQNDLASAQTLLSESQSALENQDFQAALDKVQLAQSLAKQVTDEVNRDPEKPNTAKR